MDFIDSCITLLNKIRIGRVCMKRSEDVELMNMCMVYDGEQVLVQNRVAKSWSGIAFPGGHIEKKESFTEAVIREVYEETGLTISFPKLCGIKSWYKGDTRCIVLLYKTNSYAGELRSSREGEVSWVNIKDLKQMNLAQDMFELLNVFVDDSIQEFIYCDENEETGYKLL